MKNRIWRILNMYTVLVFVMTLGAVVTLFLDLTAGIFACAVAVVCTVLAIAEGIRLRKQVARYLSRFADTLQNGNEKALRDALVPVILTAESGEIVWYNEAFKNGYEEAAALPGRTLADVLGADLFDQLTVSHHAEVKFGNRIYKMYRFSEGRSAEESCAYMLFDITSHRKLKQEYLQSRPVVAIVDIDNFDEITRGIKDSDAAALKSVIHNRVEKWGAGTNGIVRRIHGDSYMFVFDERNVGKLIEDKFKVLDEVRALKIGEYSPTLSIGIGRSTETLGECQELAMQALEMAQSRGGDQVAIKNASGEYRFFGGMTAATEKHTKARARVLASAMRDLMKSADHVILMGHQHADLDCLGSAYGLWKLARSFEKDAYLVMNEKTGMAPLLYDRIRGMNEEFRAYRAEEVKPLITDRTLLVITDVHRASFTEAPELVDLCRNVVVIDHHRKAVDYIQKAVIFYHETAASSASEMVTEMLQYVGPRAVGQAEAEALLAGIMLDTKNFCLNAGVRTFEASAYLRNKGADPIQVKKLFSGTMEDYHLRAAIVASAVVYGNTAIAVCKENSAAARLAAAQAADELLGIQGVAASFVLCRIENGQINISARSLGSMNVQVIMESLGGGGHRTMAACQLEGVGFEETVSRLKNAIDTYQSNL